MLIKSNRYRKGDLDHWKSLVEMDRMHYESNKEKMQKKESEAIETIKEFSKQKCGIGVSWGKDSITVAHLSIRAGVDANLFYVKIDPTYNPHYSDVRDEFFKKYNTRYKEIAVKHPYYYNYSPNMNKEKELQKPVNEGFRISGRLFDGRYVSGVRAEESGARKISAIVHGKSTKKACRPILYWTNKDVFAYLEHYNLPIHPNYAMSNGGLYDREFLRVGPIGGMRGSGHGREFRERMYYLDVINKYEKIQHSRLNA